MRADLFFRPGVRLLGLIERHEGLVLLATNRPEQLDPALARRVSYHVAFTPPGAAARAAIWRGLVPPSVPTDPTDAPIDFDRLGPPVSSRRWDVDLGLGTLRGGRLAVRLRCLGIQSLVDEVLGVVERAAFKAVFELLGERAAAAAGTCRVCGLGCEREKKVVRGRRPGRRRGGSRRCAHEAGEVKRRGVEEGEPGDAAQKRLGLEPGGDAGGELGEGGRFGGGCYAARPVAG